MPAQLARWGSVRCGRVPGPCRRKPRSRPVRDGSIGRCAGRSSRWSRTIPASSIRPSGWTTSGARTADAACLSAGGFVAYYPTQDPSAPPQRVAGRHAIRSATLVAGCRKLGMVVVARTDPHAVHEDVHDGASGLDRGRRRRQPRRHWATPELWVTCALGPYNFEFMTEVDARDRHALPRRRHLHAIAGRASRHVLLRALPARISRRRPGCDLPRTNDPHDPARARLHRLAAGRGSSSCGSCGTPRSATINPDARFIPNGRRARSLDMKRVGELARDPVRRPPGAAAA